MEMDLNSFIKVQKALTFFARSAGQAGDTIDTAGYESLTFIIYSGQVGAGDADFKLEHAPDVGGSPGTFVDVDADDVLGTPPTIGPSTDNNAHSIGYRGKERFVRVTSVETSTWTTHEHGAAAILGNPSVVPTT